MCKTIDCLELIIKAHISIDLFVQLEIDSKVYFDVIRGNHVELDKMLMLFLQLRAALKLWCLTRANVRCSTAREGRSSLPLVDSERQRTFG